MKQNIGFTGTRNGMTEEQKSTLTFLLWLFHEPGNMYIHGDCIGGDEEFHMLVKKMDSKASMMIFPPLDPKFRAWKYGMVQPEDEYLARNRRIVSVSNTLIGAPKNFTDIARSGTWYTIRHAKKIKSENKTRRLDRVIIIFPDGSINEF
jgi:hypothetical protein